MRNHPNNNYRQQGNRNADQRQQNPRAEFNGVFKPEWISVGADSDMNNYADEAGNQMKRGGLTNAKIRSIYGEIKRIQMSGFSKNTSAFYLLKPKVAYAYGREKNNRETEAGLSIFKQVFDNAFKYVTDDNSYNNFCNLMEAIIAYHRAYGGK